MHIQSKMDFRGLNVVDGIDATINIALPVITQNAELDITPRQLNLEDYEPMVAAPRILEEEDFITDKKLCSRRGCGLDVLETHGRVLPCGSNTCQKHMHELCYQNLCKKYHLPFLPADEYLACTKKCYKKIKKQIKDKAAEVDMNNVLPW